MKYSRMKLLSPEKNQVEKKYEEERKTNEKYERRQVEIKKEKAENNK